MHVHMKPALPLQLAIPPAAKPIAAPKNGPGVTGRELSRDGGGGGQKQRQRSGMFDAGPEPEGAAHGDPGASLAALLTRLELGALG